MRRATGRQLAHRLDLYPSNVHHHLTNLSRMGLVLTERTDGKKEVYYTFAKPKKVVAEYPFGRMTFEFN